MVLLDRKTGYFEASFRIDDTIGSARVQFINWGSALKLRVSFADWEACLAGGIPLAVGSLAKAFCQMQNPHNKQFSNYIPGDQAC